MPRRDEKRFKRIVSKPYCSLGDPRGKRMSDFSENRTCFNALRLVSFWLLSRPSALLDLVSCTPLHS